MAAIPHPRLYSTNVIEDVHRNDDIIGLKLSYVHRGCFFTVLISVETPQSDNQRRTDEPSSVVLEDLIARFNQACTWTEQDRTIEDIDKRLDPIWQEAEDVVRTAAFEHIIAAGRTHGRALSREDISEQHPMRLTEYLFPSSFSLQIVSAGDVFDILCRPDLPPWQPFIAEAGLPSAEGLMSADPERIWIVEIYRPHVLKVQVGEQVFCCKLSNTGAQSSFSREFEILQRIHGSKLKDELNIPQLRGVVEVENGIIGLLIDWIEIQEYDLMALLRRQNNITDSVRQKWADQVSRTVKGLHTLKLTWGDAKTSNVLIDKACNAWLTDFGGGFTRGWIDESLYDSPAGDLQGLENTLLDIFGKR